jgi:radical SAM protein with 4Fe4S-binding SPASM domain
MFNDNYIKNERDSIYEDFERKMSTQNLFSSLMLIDLMVTELCNRTCEFCPRHDPAIYPNLNLHMDFDLFKKIIVDLSELNYQNRLLYCGFGESLLYKHIFDSISFIRDNMPWQQNIHLVSNGDRLDKNTIKELFLAGLNKLYISLYDGEEQIDYFNNLFYELGIEEDKYLLQKYYKSKEENYGFVHLSNRAGKLFSGSYSGGCNTPFYALSINYDGKTLLCSHDWNKSVITGDLNSQSIYDIWVNSSTLNSYRKMLMSSREQNPCQSCNIIGTLYGNRSKKILCKYI